MVLSKIQSSKFKIQRTCQKNTTNEIRQQNSNSNTVQELHVYLDQCRDPRKHNTHESPVGRARAPLALRRLTANTSLPKLYLNQFVSSGSRNRTERSQAITNRNQHRTKQTRIAIETRWTVYTQPKSFKCWVGVTQWGLSGSARGSASNLFSHGHKTSTRNLCPLKHN